MVSMENMVVLKALVFEDKLSNGFATLTVMVPKSEFNYPVNGLKCLSNGSYKPMTHGVFVFFESTKANRRNNFFVPHERIPLTSYTKYLESQDFIFHHSIKGVYGASLKYARIRCKVYVDALMSNI